MLLQKRLSSKELIDFASAAKDPVEATCIEALEKATQQVPSILDEAGFLFVTEALNAKAPRIKWESARVIGNTASHFLPLLELATQHLLENSEHPGTVVRWSSAFTLGVILQLNTPQHQDLKLAIEQIVQREEKESIKKIYQAALKKRG
jgi:hypothetical protein